MAKADDLREEIQDLLDCGYSNNKIGDILGLDHTLVDRAVKKHNMERYVPFDEINLIEDRVPKLNDLDFEFILDDIQKEVMEKGEFLVNDASVSKEVRRFINENKKSLIEDLANRFGNLILIHVKKRCSKCEIISDLVNFYTDYKHPLGIKYSCKNCCAKTGKQYAENNPEKIIIIQGRRRARKLQLPDNLTSASVSDIKNYFKGCSLTGSSLDVHLDHVIPIAIGHGGTTYGNMVPLRSDLNISKHDRNIFEWFASVRQRFELSQEKFDTLIEWLSSANDMAVEEYRDYVYWCHDNPRNIDEINEIEAI